MRPLRLRDAYAAPACAASRRSAFSIDVEDPAWTEGQDVKAYYGITKYIPPLKPTAGDAAPPHPLFVEYTDIENLRNFPDVLDEGEEVIVTEKIHGTNARVGLIEGEWMAGSMSVRRQSPEAPEQWAQSTYWFALSLPPVRALLEDLGAQHRQVILFGEVYGSKIQDLHYGCKGTLGFRAFDLLVDGKYLDADAFLDYLRSAWRRNRAGSLSGRVRAGNDQGAFAGRHHAVGRTYSRGRCREAGRGAHQSEGGPRGDEVHRRSVPVLQKRRPRHARCLTSCVSLFEFSVLSLTGHFPVHPFATNATPVRNHENRP